MADELTRRKEMIARFARVTLKSEEAQRQRYLEKVKETNEEFEGKGSWLTAPHKMKLDNDNMSYVEPYRAEYSATGRSVTDNKENQPVNSSDQDDSQSQTGSSASGAHTNNGSVSTMRRPFRGRAWQARIIASSVRSDSVVDFDRTSTILAPTEAQYDDYDSSIKAEDVKKIYFRNYRTTDDLPIYHQRQYIINSINSYSVVIIEGATGCGKTTQVPMYILEDAILHKKQKSAPVIWVTQPRRIAAKSISNRVCDEHGWPQTANSIVGYQIGLEKNCGPETCIVYCTSGVLLQKLIHEKSLKNYSHIVIDEAHERDADTDLLLMMIRKLMRKEMSFFRLIVMSATMDIQKLKNYFSFKADFGHRPVTTPATVKVDGERPNEIQMIYMDTLASTFRINEKIPDFDMGGPNLYNECVNAAAKIIIEVIPRLDTFRRGLTESTLVFLPGLAEILKLEEKLKIDKNVRETLEIIPMHSSFTQSDQMKAFQQAPMNKRKVLLATNIAESSITVSDVGFIIDFCLTKTLRKDEITSFPTLRLDWSSKDRSIQRAGRTGRCCPGKVFRLVTQKFYKELPEYSEPELLVAPLELSVLRVKNFQMGEIKALLAVVLDPPPYPDIRKAVLELKQIGALSSTYEGKLCDIDGDLTELGKVISALPIDVHLSKLIVVASLLDVLEDAIVIAACLSTNRTVVKQEYNKQFETYTKKLEWARGTNSDLLLSLEVYKQYRELKEEQSKDNRWLYRWCENNYLDEKKLYEVQALVKEIQDRLEQVNIKVFDQPNRVRNQCEDELMLKIAFCAAFYPNYFLTKDKTEEEIHEIETIYCGLDPLKTVCVSNFPVSQVPLYKSQVMQQLEAGQVFNGLDTDAIDYIADDSRALIVFNEDNPMHQDRSVEKAINRDGIVLNAPNVDRSVHYAVKFGDRYGQLSIREYKEEAARARLDWYKEQRRMLMQPGRLLPSRMKIVSNRPANNSVILDADEDTYNDLMAQNYFVEIEHNVEQDQVDRQLLDDLESGEGISMSGGYRFSSAREMFEEDNHPLFKRGQRDDRRRPLRGPESPIHVKFESVLAKSKCYIPVIDPMSINSVILNADYKTSRRQMLVAATVHQKDTLVQPRDTSLLPNIRGLPTLMSLLFAQYYRLVYNDKLSCVAGAIFGLGWNDKDQPLERQYEVDLGFDIHITADDIKLINIGRTYISNLIKLIEVVDPGAARAEQQEQLRQIIMTLIRKRRYPMEEEPIECIDLYDGEFIKDKHNVPKQELAPLEEGQTRNFLPLMEISRHYSELDFYEAIKVNLDQLVEIRDCLVKPPLEGIRCYLCGRRYHFNMQSAIRRHMDSDVHQAKSVYFEQKLNQLRERQQQQQQQPQ